VFYPCYLKVRSAIEIIISVDKARSCLIEENATGYTVLGDNIRSTDDVINIQNIDVKICKYS